METFPRPVTAGYDDVHHGMDQGQAVHAACRLRDIWEGLLKFLATLAVADHFTTLGNTFAGSGHNECGKALLLEAKTLFAS